MILSRNGRITKVAMGDGNEVVKVREKVKPF